MKEKTDGRWAEPGREWTLMNGAGEGWIDDSDDDDNDDDIE